MSKWENFKTDMKKRQEVGNEKIRKNNEEIRKNNEEMKKEFGKIKQEWEQDKKEYNEKMSSLKQEWEQDKQEYRNKQIEKNNKPCKMCGSTNFTRQAITVKKKKSMFLAIVLLILFFPIGIVYLLVGRKENTEIVAICNNCGYKK